MPIFVSGTQFHLQGADISYIFHVMKNGQLGQLYVGRRVEQQEDFSYLEVLPAEPLGNATFPYEGDPFFSLEFLKQEYPSYGTSDYREPAIELLEKEGTRLSHFVYHSHKVIKGKPELEGLPATYAVDPDECETLLVTLTDEVAGTELTLSYTVYRERNVIIRNASIQNNGSDTVAIERLMSASVDFPHKEFDLIQLDGAWIRERHLSRHRLRPGIQSFDSKRGASSSWHHPFLALASPSATEHEGEVFGFNLVYSGNFLASVEVDTYDTTRVLMGINPFQFNWQLQPGERFQTPEVVMAYSSKGLNSMSQQFHDLYQNRLIRGSWQRKERPVLINNWEATYFTFDEQKLVDIAEAAAPLGVELFVLDDGWFKGRNDDTTSLGDFEVDKEKLPKGLKSLSDRLTSAGVTFGLWVEPEMISKDSDLYRTHPEWVLGATHRNLSNGRNQFVLDLTRHDVQKHLIETLSDVFHSADIRYVKWDMNRNMSEIGSAAWPAAQQGELTHRYILGLYTVLEELTRRFPSILFESCASGGNRFDPGMLYYMPQTWASDNTDPVERLSIQYGTSLIYPTSSIGAHVSASPNHQTGRATPLAFRMHVAMFGAFGYELDATKLNGDEKDAVTRQIARFKKERSLLQFGTFYRLLSPFDGGDTAWMTVGENAAEAVIAYYRPAAKPNPGLVRLKLAGLNEEATYEVEWTEGVQPPKKLQYKGDELMRIGWVVPPFYSGTVRTEQTGMAGDAQSAVWKLRQV